MNSDNVNMMAGIPYGNKKLLPAKKYMRTGIYFLLFMLHTSVVSAFFSYPDSLIQSKMQTGHIPGLAACIVKNGEIIWTATYGYANIEQNKTVEPSTLFQLASISKTITATTLMQLFDQGLFGLDDNINDYLNFDIHNPDYPETPITFRMLLTHSSSISDNWDIMPYYWGQDSPIPLGVYLFDYLNAAGDLYDPSLNFSPHQPGTYWGYSNIGLALSGYLVEIISGQSFSSYCNEHLFLPLAMTETSWFLDDLDTTGIAMPYEWAGDSFEPTGFFGYSDYPSGQLRTSITQLAHFMISYMQHGTYNDQKIIDSITVDLILSQQIPSLYSPQGIAWFNDTIAGNNLWGHNGGDIGMENRMHFIKETNTGVIILSNGENYDALEQIETVLFCYADDSLLSIKPENPLARNTLDFYAYPNPFAQNISFPFYLGQRAKVGLRVSDLMGRIIYSIPSQMMEPGKHTLSWKGIDNKGCPIPDGAFICTLTLNNNVISKYRVVKHK